MDFFAWFALVKGDFLIWFILASLLLLFLGRMYFPGAKDDLYLQKPVQDPKAEKP